MLKTWTNNNPLSESEKLTWDNFVLRDHAEGTLFQSQVWQKVLQQTYGLAYFQLAEIRDEKIVGVVSLYLLRSLTGGKNLYALPYTVYGGILANDKESAQILHNAAMVIAQSEKAGMVHLRNTVPSGLDLPTTNLHVHFIKTLDATEDACLNAIPRKSRATIRNAMQKFKLSYSISRDYDLLWELHAANLKKLGSPVFPKKYFRNIMEILGDQVDILFVNYEGKAIAGVMTFYYKDVCNPYFSGSFAEYNFTGANNYMYYALMCHALKRGYKRYDFGKSRRDTGPYQFKCNMGFEPTTLPYQFIFNTEKHIPNLNPSNPKLALFIKLWSKQPLWTSKILGSYLNRFFP